jgi:hypothetical protein
LREVLDKETDPAVLTQAIEQFNTVSLKKFGDAYSKKAGQSGSSESKDEPQDAEYTKK